MGEEADYTVLVDWDGDGDFEDAGEDVSTDFVSASISRGFSDPIARVARVGRATILLNNSDRQYSPELDADVIPRREVMIQMTYDGVTTTRFRGFIDKIRPQSGRWERRRVELVCSDAMVLLGQGDAKIPLSVDVYADEIIEDIVGAVYTPSGTNYERGLNLFPVSADRWAWEIAGQAVEEVTAAAKIGDVCLSDWGLFFIAADGTPTYYNRHHMSFDDTIVLTLDGTMQEIDYDLAVSSVRNAVDVTCYPRSVGQTNEVLARISQDDAPMIEPGGTKTFVMRFRDPANQKIKLGGLDCVDPLEEQMDYICTNDSAGEGDDVTDQVNVSADFYGDQAEVTLENTTADPAYIQKLQVRGLAVRAREPVVILIKDDASIALNQRWTLSIDAILMSSQVKAYALAEHLLDRYKDAAAVVSNVGVVANTTPTRMAAVRDLELCQLVSVSEHQTGLSSYSGYIWQLQETIGLTVHTVTFGLVGAYELPGDPWIWDTSEWDGGDVWIY